MKPAASLSGARFGKEPAAGSKTGGGNGAKSKKPKGKARTDGRLRRTWRIVQNQRNGREMKKCWPCFFGPLW
nr:hypothetical protein [Bacillaceae bacterium]